MSLCCAECKFDIEYGTDLYAVTAQDDKESYALCGPCCAQVPKEARNPTGLIVASGATVCVGESTRNFNGSYTWTGFRRGKPLFHLKTEAVRRYLPNISAMLSL